VSSPNGHFLCLDPDPDQEGKKDQVIAYFVDSGERPVLAPDLKTWFEQVVGALEEGRISASYDETLNEWKFDHPGFLLLDEMED